MFVFLLRLANSSLQNDDQLKPADARVDCPLFISKDEEKRFYKYQMLKLGEDYVNCKIRPELTVEQLDVLLQFKKKITSLSPKQILRYVYTKYPNFTSNSLIKDEVFDDD